MTKNLALSIFRLPHHVFGFMPRYGVLKMLQLELSILKGCVKKVFSFKLKNMFRLVIPRLLSKRMNLIAILLFGFVTAQAQQAAGDAPFTIENYYKVKWGYAEEFIILWKKNHYPLLKKAKAKGDIISIVAEKPKLHSSEEGRWDFKVTLVFKSSTLAFDPNLTTPSKSELYPDEAKLINDEQHRFELLLAHWDVLIDNVPLD